jgi:hypothetical protein
VIYGLLLLLLLLGSINYGNNLAFFLTFLLAGLGIVAMLHTWRNLAGLELIAGTNNPIFADQTACFEIHLINERNSERPNIKLQTTKRNFATTDLRSFFLLFVILCLAVRYFVRLLGESQNRQFDPRILGCLCLLLTLELLSCAKCVAWQQCQVLRVGM